MAIQLRELGKEGGLSRSACERMEKSWVMDVDQLYCLIRFALRNGTLEMRKRLAQDLEIQEDRLEAYMKYLGLEVSESITNPSSVTEYPTGCLITTEQMEQMERNWKAMDDPIEYVAWKRQEYLKACMGDSSFEKFCLEGMASDQGFRNWFFSGPAATIYESQEVHDQLSAKREEVRNRFYREHPEYSEPQ
jgi:hypothetical protein